MKKRARRRRRREYYSDDKEEEENGNMQIEHCTGRSVVYHDQKQVMARSVVYRNTIPTVVSTQQVPVLPVLAEEEKCSGGPRVRFALGENSGMSERRLQNGSQAQENISGGLGYGGYGYMTSPLPVPPVSGSSLVEKRDYLGGEYNYYPTPLREGIYRLASDANGLTTLFSEENPNACSIV